MGGRFNQFRYMSIEEGMPVSNASIMSRVIGVNFKEKIYNIQDTVHGFGFNTSNLCARLEQ